PGVDNFQPDGPSYLPGISSNGLIVAFGSSATNLVDGDQNKAYDVFVRTLPGLPGPCSGCGRTGATFSGPGYRFVAADGGIFAFGDAKFHGSTGAIKLARPIVGMDRSVTGDGYRFVSSDGGIFTFGDAKFLGSMGGQPLAKPIVGMCRTRLGDGYWLVASDGGIFSFGAAGFQGSTGDIKLAQPIVGMAN